jgi:hypothetical protein
MGNKKIRRNARPRAHVDVICMRYGKILWDKK